ncbi:HesA/MoeB/ThiF family protein [Vibrio metschnikovii]|uniref:HesA/MoeB/ThiF family protein n=1 Tax=Vibrio metschnikovii TaxID=28172 RepID=UPI001C310B37|nr:HesA/MoeB/ThiF family protein [Vibrio metschnikovii]
MLTDKQFLRYQRQICLPDIAEQGQITLLASKVLIIGCGGLGNAVGQYLAAAGVGKLILADDDTVEVSNLSRQIAFQTQQVGMSKVSALQQSLQRLNPEVRIRCVNRRMDEALLNLEVPMADVVVDCSDNSVTRFAINQVCHQHGAVLISGSAIGWQGQCIAFNFRQPHTACYRCLVAEHNSARNCSDSGVIGPVVGMIGNLQALMTLQVLLDIDPVKYQQLHYFDGHKLSWQQWRLAADPHCPVCNSAFSIATSSCTDHFHQAEIAQ